MFQLLWWCARIFQLDVSKFFKRCLEALKQHDPNSSSHLLGGTVFRFFASRCTGGFTKVLELFLRWVNEGGHPWCRAFQCKWVCLKMWNIPQVSNLIGMMMSMDLEVKYHIFRQTEIFSQGTSSGLAFRLIAPIAISNFSPAPSSKAKSLADCRQNLSLRKRLAFCGRPSKHAKKDSAHACHKGSSNSRWNQATWANYTEQENIRDWTKRRIA